ncbi:CcdB family protein [Quisquiliibacterium transsilvanicum]|uniref:Toxin CcdB n=1 Tax=Quisquiliibacterium transsilvanicum TaxID=1549638 RepID=A0A7W8HFB9_9BURK|nr:CcdB family protein [Quisquiliibacterium transsilvanicum]MBB5271029.1 toxin CcdB [Quisquiliibacterium transsilvanicum]
MAQFDVHANADPGSRARMPYLVDVQSDLLGDLASRVVVPLVRADDSVLRPLARLTPVFELEGREFVFVTPELAGVSRSVLGRKVASLASRRHEIVAAFDMLISGV